LSKLKLAWTGPKIKTRTAAGTEIEVSGTASTPTVLRCEAAVGVSTHLTMCSFPSQTLRLLARMGILV